MSRAAQMASSRFAKIKPFDYEQEARQAYADFPAIAGKVIFIDVTNDKLVYPKNVPQKVADKIARDKFLRKEVDKLGKTGMSRNLWWDGEEETYLLLSLKKKDFSLLSAAAADAQERAFSFDHELAHAAIPHDIDIYLNRNFNESVADVYATIRHFQRYGTETGLVDALVGHRALDLVFKKTGIEHFTSPVVEKLLEQRRSRDWKKMTPQQAHAFALAFASDNWPGPASLKKTDAAFKSFHNNWKRMRQGNARPLVQFAASLKTRQTKDYRKWGNLGLQYFVENYGVKQPWKNVRRQFLQKSGYSVAAAKSTSWKKAPSHQP